MEKGATRHKRATGKHMEAAAAGVVAAAAAHKHYKAAYKAKAGGVSSSSSSSCIVLPPPHFRIIPAHLMNEQTRFVVVVVVVVLVVAIVRCAVVVFVVLVLLSRERARVLSASAQCKWELKVGGGSGRLTSLLSCRRDWRGEFCCCCFELLDLFSSFEVPAERFDWSVRDKLTAAKSVMTSGS